MANSQQFLLHHPAHVGGATVTAERSSVKRDIAEGRRRRGITPCARFAAKSEGVNLSQPVRPKFTPSNLSLVFHAALFPFESRGLTGVSENAIWSPDASRKVDILTFRFRTIDLSLSHEWTQQSYYINFPASLQ